jgi:hypothetical protein
MLKKILSLMLLLSSLSVFAATASSPVAKKKHKPHKQAYEQNNPLAGSHQQSSEQQFGAPAVTGTKGQKYQYGDDTNGNNPLAGSHQQSSEQQFGAPAITGTKGQKPQRATSDYEQQNNPMVGGRQSSSDQIFGNPGDPTNQ